MKKCKFFYHFWQIVGKLDFSAVFVIIDVAVSAKAREQMSSINGINFNLAKNNLNLYTKRTCSDNSELYITSKLNMLYEQTISNKNHYESRRKLRKMIENSRLDEIV